MLVVGNGRLISRDETVPYLEDGAVAVDGGLIAAVGPTAALRAAYPAASFLDARRGLIMPGLINAHTHLYSSLARGLSLPGFAPRDFPAILAGLWWRLDRALTGEDIRYSALVGLMDCIKNGVTCVFDHHSSPGAVEESLFVIGEAVREAGVRACLCYEVSDRDGTGPMSLAIRENVDFIRHADRDADGLVRGMFGLHASLTLSDATLDLCAAQAEGRATGYHVHVAEAAADVDASLRLFGRRPVERLAAFGLLGPLSLAAHCVHVDHAEMDVLRANGARVVHNPLSNMNNAVGAAPVPAMLARGLTVGLGTDGYRADMLESARAAQLLQRHALGDPAAGSEAFSMLLAANPAIAAVNFPHPVGRLVPGAYADLIVCEYDPPTPLTNADGHLLFGLSGRAVETTVIAGRVVMERRRLVLDEAAILARARELSARLWQRL